MSSIITPLTAVVNAGVTSATSASATKNQYTTLRDYQHANKIFTRNKSALAPKTKNWFHVYFELDPSAINMLDASLSKSVTQGRINWDSSKIPGFGVLVKTVSLPNFKFDVKKANQYNKWNLTTTKINYDAVDISFWDDTLDFIRSFWYAYYQYMIADASYVNWNSPLNGGEGIDVPSQWTPTTSSMSSVYTTSWDSYGMDTINSSGVLNRSNPFFRSIRIYQFNRDLTPANTTIDQGVKYTEYVLVNPLITSFAHDNVDFSTSEFMTNKMSIEYETVLYNSGYITNTNSSTLDSEIASWDYIQDNFLDTTPSPLTGFQQPNNHAQLGSALQIGASLVSQTVQLATHTGQATAASFLTTAIGSATSVNNLIKNPSGNPVISVPTVTQGYGTGGNPPKQS